MALLEDRTAVFIVRVWCERGDGDSAVAEWRGSVEHVRSGVLKFTNGPNRIRFRMSKPTMRNPGTSTICQTWDGTTLGVNGPDRTMHWVLTETTGACAGDWCTMFTSGKATWDSTATFDSEAMVPTYDDTATFQGSLSGP